MYYNPRRVGGLLLFLAAVQFSIGLMWAAARYPGYSIADNYISDLGVGPAAPIFNGSIILLGLLVIASAYFLQQAYARPAFTALFVIVGAGAVGVGVFTEDFGLLHGIFALVAFIFGGAVAIATAALVRSPLRYISLGLGVLALIALLLFLTDITLGLGVGGMERMIAYPVLGWAMAYGGYLMAVQRQVKQAPS